jgi:hypothetical protein
MLNLVQQSSVYAITAYFDNTSVYKTTRRLLKEFSFNEESDFKSSS